MLDKLKGKFAQDVSWNMFSLIIVGISGLIINIIIGRVYGAASLGVFNQVLTIYVVVSQIATGGFHFSVQKYVPQYSSKLEECDRIISIAFILTFFLALFVCSVCYLIADDIGNLLDSPDVSIGILITLPGLLCFGLNKILLQGLNGLRHMRIYAFAQGLRGILILGGIISLVYLNVDSALLPIVFTFTEFVLLILLLPYFYHIFPFRFRLSWVYWAKRHFDFSRKAFVSGLLADINPRIDILVLGYFSSDGIVGIYSFAAMIAEGISQIPIVIQTNLNPLLTRLSISKDFAELKYRIKHNLKILVPIMLLISIITMGLFPIIVEYVTAEQVFYEAWPILGILLVGITWASSYSPFSMYLNQAGHPGLYSLYLFSVVLINTILNFMLIPIFGMYGAAIATFIAYVSSIYILKLFIFRVDGVAI